MADDLASYLTTPLHALHQRLGGKLVPFAGYALPIHYPTGIMAEHLWTRAHAGLFDVSHMGQVIVQGADADVALETLMPADIKGLGLNRVRYSLLLDTNGGILDDLMVTRRPNDVLLVVNGAVKHADIAHLRSQLEPEGLALTYLEGAALLALQGPSAAVVMARLAPESADLRFMQAGSIDVAGYPTWVSRSGYTGEDGFELAIPAPHAMAVAEALLTDPEVKPIGLGARDSLRLEAGLPLYGHDITTQHTPIEADLAFAISKRRKLEKGFPGAEKIMDQLLNGSATTKRVGLRLAGRQPAREGAPIFAGDVPVGVVTSGGFAPSLNAPIAMGSVTISHAADGTHLDIEVRDKKLAATVVPMPFVPHRYHR